VVGALAAAGLPCLVHAEPTPNLDRGSANGNPCPIFIDTGTGLTPLGDGALAWGDYDNDGDLDVLLTGYDIALARVSKLYRNDGSGAFVEVAAGLTGVSDSSVDWGDYDNDGDLDILLAGYSDSGGYATKVIRNDGNATFTDVATGLEGASLCSAAWGDYDNDGDLDIAMAGEFDGTWLSRIYRNDGNASFTDIAAGLIGVIVPSVAWGDYDNDGDLDLLLAGGNSFGEYSKIYRNNGDGSFTDIAAGLIGVGDCSAAWGDYDNDGDLDILLAGFGGGNYIARVYRNNGNGSFTDIAAGLTGVTLASAAWGDHDNDGDLDILLTGFSNSGAVSKIYRNDGNATFTDIAAGLNGVFSASVAWGDYDNDGNLDVLESGYDAEGWYLGLYRNDGCTPNSPPSSPAALSTFVDGAGTSFFWNPSSDAQTGASGLHYNIRIGTTPGGSEISAPMALASGYRQVARLGGIRSSGWKMVLPLGTYYWSVQAIDPAWAGSPFAAEQSFTVAVADVPTPSESPSAFALHPGRPNPFSSRASIGFDLPHPERVTLTVYDVNGRHIRTILDGWQPAGRNEVEWDGTTDDGGTAPGGVYFYSLESDRFRDRQRVVRLR
jgi:hypothetical protein